MQALPAAPAPAPRNQLTVGASLAAGATLMLFGGMLAVWAVQRSRAIDAEGHWLPDGVAIPDGWDKGQCYEAGLLPATGSAWPRTATSSATASPSWRPTTCWTSCATRQPSAGWTRWPARKTSSLP